MRKWKKLTLSFMLSIVAVGGGMAGQGILLPERVSAAANAVPAYEVKFLADPDLVLDSSGSPRSEVVDTFDLNSTPQAIRVGYFDTDTLEPEQQGVGYTAAQKREQIRL